jgi:hypothetical protein
MAPLWIRRAAPTENPPADDGEASDCGICFLPLDSGTPPPFQVTRAAPNLFQFNPSTIGSNQSFCSATPGT